MSHLRRGVTVLEMLIALTIVAIALGVAFSWLAASSRSRRDVSDLQFAKTKVSQIFDELEAYVESGQEINARSLDQFNDPAPTPTLTIRSVDPDHPISGNKPGTGPGGWYYYRQITVSPLANPRDPSGRLVTIRFFRAVNGELKELLATSTIIRTLVNKTPPRQVYDVYFLAIANVPGWWVRTSTLRNVVDGALKEILMRNPNLEIRAHWITVMGYGRDPHYAPFIAEDFEENPNGRPRFGRMAYYYLGTSFIYTPIHEKISYYTTPFFSARLNAMIDGELKLINEDSYSVADQYNHAVRYPEAVRIYNRLVKEAIDRGEQPPEPPYQLLFERFYFDESLRNPVVINLHGEMIPFPPVRNYSDPVKRPDVPALRGVRLVAHPERIAYPNGSMVRVRVYAFYTNPDRPEINNSWIDHDRLRRATLLIGPVGSSTTLVIRAIDGGVPRATGSSGGYNPNDYRYSTMSSSYCPLALPAGTLCTSGGMGYNVSYVGTTEGRFILVHLYNVPLKAPFRNNKGLPVNYRLYGMEYVPTPLGPSNDPFRYDLASNNSIRGPVNTARLIIILRNVPRSPSREEPLTIRYAIGELNVSDMANTNRPFVDETYSWIGYTIDWRSENLPEIPITEQYQYQGDPRLNPYADAKWRHRYNWYFPYRAGEYWRYDWKWRRDGFSWMGGDSWGGVPVDVPAFFNMVRTSYQRAQAVYTSMTGFSNYYVALGGEIGGDTANQVACGPPVNARLYGGSEGSFVYEKAITQDGCSSAPSQRGLKNVADIGGNWDSAAWGRYALPFLGELYPDSMWDYWKEHGNLPTPRFQRRRWRDSLPGPDFPNYRQVRTSTPGCVSFFNAVPAGRSNGYRGRFSHNWRGRGDLTSVPEGGNELFDTFRIPHYPSVPAPRPFSIDTRLNSYPPEWWSSLYRNTRQRNRILVTFYSSSLGGGWRASGVVENYDPRDPNRVFRVIVNGLAPSGTEANSFLARYAIASTLFTFLVAGNPENYNFSSVPVIQQVPRVVITSPNYGDVFNSGDRLRLNYTLTWRRWDGKKYTSDYPDGYDGGDLVVTFKWQRTGEEVWHYLDNTDTLPGEYPDELHQLPANIGVNTLIINTSGWRGSYMLRIEAFREGSQLHYSYHEILVFIQ